MHIDITYVIPTAPYTRVYRKVWNVNYFSIESGVAEAERVRIHLESGNINGALWISHRWWFPLELRKVCQRGWLTYLDREDIPDADERIRQALDALRVTG